MATETLYLISSQTRNAGEARMNKRGNIGEDVAGTTRDIGSSRADFEAFDRLGPKTQAVLNYALLPISANDVWRHALMLRLNPLDRKHDGIIASDLKAKIKQLTGVSYTKAICRRRKGKNVVISRRELGGRPAAR